ncbi:MAG: NAD+ synthase [Candidatus Asgardarchaeia archaeon]
MRKIDDALLEIDLEYVEEKIINDLKIYFEKYKIEKGIVGLSGGVDSSLVATLLVRSLGNENVRGLILPSEVTSEQDINDAISVAKKLKIDFELINIKPLVYPFKEILLVKDKIALGNIMARIRMIVLYNEAHMHNGIVVGTGNKTELYVGYFTKYGDGGVDILPIGDLYKTQVWALAEKVGVPQRIVEKIPTAGLWKGQTDEEELGIKYELLDKILVRLVDYHKNRADIARELEIDPKLVNYVENMVKNSEHKRKLPYIIKIKK